MFVCHKSSQRLVQLVGSQHCFRFVQCTGVRQQAISKTVEAKVLAVLIGVVILCLRRMEQCQTDCIVVRLIPSVLAVVEHRDTIAVSFVGQVCPILSIHFVGGDRVVAALYTSDTQVVGGFRVRYTQGEFGFQQGVGRLPVYFVIEVDTVGTRAFEQADILFEDRLAMAFLHAKGFSQLSVLHQ